MTVKEVPPADLPTQHPAVLGDILRQSFCRDYNMDLQFELVSLMLILAHEPLDDARKR